MADGNLLAHALKREVLKAGDLAVETELLFLVISSFRLVGILTDRDMRQHLGLIDRTEVKTAMSKWNRQHG